MRRVLFICTGNYYRSRFAEAVFNHLAAERAVEWRAFSRGLAIELQPGDLSPFTRAALILRGIDFGHTGPTRAPLLEEELAAAEIRIALSDLEHRPMVREQFAGWEERIRFWEVADIGPEGLPADIALPWIENQVRALIDELVG